MTAECIRKDAFCIIGKEGSTEQGAGFIQRLYEEANRDFVQIQGLAKLDEEGRLPGIWGAMTDFSRKFLPWEDFDKGLYMVGVEVEANAEAPDGWQKWQVPGFCYLRFEAQGPDGMQEGLKCLKEQGLKLVGAVQEYTDLVNGKQCLLFPSEKL